MMRDAYPPEEPAPDREADALELQQEKLNADIRAGLVSPSEHLDGDQCALWLGKVIDAYLGRGPRGSVAADLQVACESVIAAAIQESTKPTPGRGESPFEMFERFRREFRS
jgi:hypothetical protein